MAPHEALRKRKAIDYAEEEDFDSQLPAVRKSCPGCVKTDDGLAKLGQTDFKLSEVKLPVVQPKLVLTVEKLVHEYLVPVATMYPKPKTDQLEQAPETTEESGVGEINQDFSQNIKTLDTECSAILQGLVKYARIHPKETASSLFYYHQKDYNKAYLGIKNNQNEYRQEGDWMNLMKVLKEEDPYFKKILVGNKATKKFVRGMTQIMRLGMEVNVIGFKNCLLGYIFGFWLAKLYDKKNVNDEDLPRELSLAKDHFLEYYGLFDEDIDILVC